ncbi:MAG: alpha/beta hydrolase family protein [Bacteroidota bacterium]
MKQNTIHFLFKGLTLCIIFLFSQELSAAKVDTVAIFSNAMKKEVKTVTIIPESYKSDGKAYPVLYLLHGYSDDHGGWINKVPHVASLSDQYDIIIICPDGGYGSWYLDSPIDEKFRYETFVSKELIKWTDEMFNTIEERKGRAITGLSMGGHGGLYLAFKHQDIFGAAGSMSGGVDLRPFPENWDLAKRLGDYAEHPERWEINSVMNLTHLLKNDHLKIIIDCGIDDFFYTVNVKLHEKLLERNIPHDFISRPGNHNWEYWTNAIDYQVLFFHHFFTK